MTTDFNNRNTIIASGKGLVALFPAGHLPEILQAISGRQQQQAGNTFPCCVTFTTNYWSTACPQYYKIL